MSHLETLYYDAKFLSTTPAESSEVYAATDRITETSTDTEPAQKYNAYLKMPDLPDVGSWPIITVDGLPAGACTLVRRRCRGLL